LTSALLVGAPFAALGWLGRQGTRAIAALVVIGITLPWLGQILKPYVPHAVFTLLCISFLRLDAEALKGYLKRPGLVIAATAWTSIAVPVLVGVGCLAIGLDRTSPDLYLGLMLQAIASPMMAAPALAALMGLDATLVLATLVTSTALIPLTATVFAELFIGPELMLSSTALGLKLLAMLVGSALLGFGLRRLAGMAAIARHNDRINGFNVLVLLVFVAGFMEGVGPRFLAEPLFASAVTLLAFGMFFIVLAVTMLVFVCVGRQRALALAFMASQRNSGLMVAAASGTMPELTWLYFGLSQLPIYLSPQLLAPLARRVSNGPVNPDGLEKEGKA
jgi:hypothetical protein